MRTETSVQIHKVYYSDKRYIGNTYGGVTGGVTEKNWNEGGGSGYFREGLQGRPDVVTLRD